MMKFENAKSSGLLSMLHFGFLAQMHVQKTSDSYYISLIADPEAFIKSHIVSVHSA